MYLARCAEVLPFHPYGLGAGVRYSFGEWESNAIGHQSADIPLFIRPTIHSGDEFAVFDCVLDAGADANLCRAHTKASGHQTIHNQFDTRIYQFSVHTELLYQLHYKRLGQRID